MQLKNKVMFPHLRSPFWQKNKQTNKQTKNAYRISLALSELQQDNDRISVKDRISRHQFCKLTMINIINKQNVKEIYFSHLLTKGF